MLGINEDINYSLALLKKINNLQINGVSLTEYFKDGDVSLWTFQQFFICAQIRKFSKTHSFEQYVTTEKKELPWYKKAILIPAYMLILLVSCIALIKFKMSHPQVVVLCSDFLKPGTRTNARLYNVYGVFKKNDVSFFEVVHVYDLKQTLRNLFIRRKVVFYFETIHFFSFMFPSYRASKLSEKELKGINLASFTDEEKKFVQELLLNVFRNISLSMFKIHFFSKILGQSSVKRYVSIDEIRYANEIILACQRNGIKTCMFQHSNFDYLNGLDTLPPETYIFPDVFFVWNTYWKNRIPELSPLYAHYKERLRIGGRAYAYTPPKYTQRREARIKTEKISVLFPYEVNLTSNQIRPYIQALLTTKKIHIFFTTRDDFDIDLQKEKYFGTVDISRENVTLVEPSQKQKVWEDVDVVLGVYSGFLDESIEFCKPVGVLKTDYPIFNRFDNVGMATTLDIAEDIYTQLLNIQNTPESILIERRERLISGAGDPRVAVTEFIES